MSRHAVVPRRLAVAGPLAVRRSLALAAVALVAVTAAVAISFRPWAGTRTTTTTGSVPVGAPSVAPPTEPSTSEPEVSNGLARRSPIPSPSSKTSPRTSSSSPKPSPPGPATRVVNPDNYPWPATDTWVADGHGYYAGECTSFAAWAVRTSGRPSPDWLGNANMWHAATASADPHVGDVAQWDPNYHDAGSAGHVAFVAGVTGRTIKIYEYNNTAPGAGGFHRLTIRTITLDDEPGTRAQYPSRYLRF
jgi:surface antigen